MDYRPILEVLYAERERVQKAITALEQMLPNVTPTAPLRLSRGRKSMSSEERIAVSARMKAYWAKKRKERASK